MRGFLGFPLQEAFAEELGLFARVHCEKPSLPGDLHLTVKFLSEFSYPKFCAVLPELNRLGPPPAMESLLGGKIEVWPTASVLLCEVPIAFRQWQAQVNDLLERREFLHERHPEFRPHVTLGRGAGRFTEADSKQFLGRKMALRKLVLYRSQPLETGRRHHEYMSPLFGRP